MKRLAVERLHPEEIQRVVFQPGNGTKYELVLVPLDHEFMVSWVPSDRAGRACAVFGRDSLLHWRYAMEKLQIKGADLNAVMAVLHEVMGVEVALEPGYDEHCEFEGVPLAAGG